MEDEKKAILDLLFCDSAKRRSVISIVGMGGLGKTTLAKKVYKDPRIRSRFDLLVWIDVSQQYEGDELLRNLVKGVCRKGNEKLGKMTRKDLEQKLHETLLAKTYLIVMDDVWDTEVWKIVDQHLPDEGNGSKVLITTRSGDVAGAADPSTRAHELRFLNAEESWELFLRKAFPGEDGRRACTEKLEEQCRKMVAKCGGLPLALVVLGGLYSQKKRSITWWDHVSEKIDWQANDEGYRCMQILALSYADLPDHLKSCFLYLGVFPEDYEIEVQKLIGLWIAEGFIRGKGNTTLEELAERYLEELVQRCLVLVEESSPTHDETCRIHDLLRDLSMLEAEEIGFFNFRGKPLEAASHRRISLHTAPEEYISQLKAAPKLRALLGFTVLELEGGSIPAAALTLSSLLYLHTLYLSGRIENQPPQIDDYQWPPTLTKLTLQRSGLDRDPLPSLGKLSELRVLFLLKDSYQGKETTCGRGGFPELRTLRVEYLDQLEKWTVEDGAMPLLVRLRISGCSGLKMLPRWFKGAARLEELVLVNMAAELNGRVKNHEGEDWENIRHIPSIKVDHRRVP